MLSLKKKMDENILFIYTGNSDNLGRAQMPTVPGTQPPFSDPSIKTRKMGLPSGHPQRHIKGLKISAPRVLLIVHNSFPRRARCGGKNGARGVRRLHLFSALRPERWPHLSQISSPPFTLLLSTCWAQHTVGIASTQAERDPYSCTSIQKWLQWLLSMDWEQLRRSRKEVPREVLGQQVKGDRYQFPWTSKGRE